MQGGEVAGLAKVSCYFCVKRRDLFIELSHNILRRQNNRNWAEAVLADLGKGRSGGAAFDFFHVALTPIEHEIIGSVVVALHGYEALVDGNRGGRNGKVADRSTGRKKESTSGQETR